MAKLKIGPIKTKFDAEFLLTILLVFKSAYNWDMDRKDLRVLAYLHARDNELTDTIKDSATRSILIFTKESKEKIYTKMGISYNSFNNGLSNLRKFNLIQNNNKLRMPLNITNGNVTDLTLNILFEHE